MAAAAARPAADPHAELLLWKLWGSAAWHGALFALGATVWHAAMAGGSSSILTTWTRLLCLYLTSAGVLYAQRRLLASGDVPPVRAPRLGLGAKSWVSLFAARCVLRSRTPAAALDAAALYAAAALSGAYGVGALAGGGLPRVDADRVRAQHFLAAYGALLGTLYATVYLITAGNVLAYPIIERHRYFRLRQRLRAMARSALLLPTAALALSLAAALLLPFGIATPPSAALALRAWRAGALAAFAWAAAAHALEVVFTESVAFADPDPDVAGDPTAPLLAALRSHDPLVQAWALRDLAAVAEGAPPSRGCARRRAAVFSDETGASGWTPLASYCLAELDDLVAVVAASLPSLAAAGKAGGGTAAAAAAAAGAPRWNVLQVSPTGAKGAGSREQELAVWHLQARHYRAVWCLRALAGLAAASLTEDAYGVAQLSRPNLADALTALLSVTRVTSLHVRHMSSIPHRAGAGAGALASATRALLPAGGGATAAAAAAAGAPNAHHVDAAAYALLDAAKAATYRVTLAFGPVLNGVLGAASRPPAHGAPAELAQLLDSFLALSE